MALEQLAPPVRPQQEQLERRSGSSRSNSSSWVDSDRTSDRTKRIVRSLRSIRSRMSVLPLPDSFEAVDALQLDVEVFFFNHIINHIKIVPEAATALWCECYIKASNGLSDALELDPTQDAASCLIIRRSFIWSIILPQLIFRNLRMNSIKKTEIIIMRRTAFLGRNYGALLNMWETDRKKALRLARKRKPEDEKVTSNKRLAIS
jgi:hypothetical protein